MGRQMAVLPAALAPLIVALVSLPLALGQVSPNAIYGIRTAATLASEAAWYRANYVSGVIGVAAGFFGFAVNFAVLRRPWLLGRKIVACLLSTLAAVGVAIVPGLLAA